jgi:hypothetical protein
MSDYKLQNAINRGQRAEAMLKDDLLKETLDTLERDYIAAWRQSPARDTDGRERLWQAVQVVGKMRDHLVTVLNNGKLAQRQLDELIEREKSAARKPR